MTDRFPPTDPPAIPALTAPMVEVRGVTRAFGGTRAVDDVTLDVRTGEFLTILGPSGSGKTTLLRMIAGFLAPTRGEIVVHGRPVADLPPHKRSIGVVFQRLALFPHLDAFDNVAYPLRMRGFAKHEIPERVARMFALVRLDGLERRRIHALSGGQQQRVAIARALVFEPDLVLLDEPLAALDRQLREEMQLEFRRIQQTLGVTTINVTHDQREALVMSDRVAVMDRGRVLQHAPPAQTYRDPADAFVASFIGVTNLLPGVAAAPRDGVAQVRVGRWSGAARWIDTPSRAPAPAPGAEPALDAAPDAISGTSVEDATAAAIIGVAAPPFTLDCALRAERVRIGRPGAPLSDTDVVLEGVLERHIFEGDRAIHEVRVPVLDGAVLRAIDRDTDGPVARAAPGDAVRVGWRTHDLLVFAR
jgi:putative spermidine/putrescine transport system ATP-binding protein